MICIGGVEVGQVLVPAALLVVYTGVLCLVWKVIQRGCKTPLEQYLDDVAEERRTPVNPPRRR